MITSLITKKVHLNFVKCDFKLAFNNFIPHNKTEFQYTTLITHLKRYLFQWIEYFVLKECNFPHIIEKSIETKNIKRYITYEK